MFPSANAAVIEGNDFEKAEQVLDLLGDIDIKLNAVHAVYVLTALQLALTNGQFINPNDAATLPVELFARDLSEALGAKAPALQEIAQTGWAGVEQARAREVQHKRNLMREALESRTRPQLNQIAKDKKMRGYSSMKRAELIQALLG